MQSSKVLLKGEMKKVNDTPQPMSSIDLDSGVARAIELVGPQLHMCNVLTTPTNCMDLSNRGKICKLISEFA